MLLDEAQSTARTSLDVLGTRVAAGEVGGGIYLWGCVGRGKTMLMDQFYDSVPVAKRRIHFHRFYADLHNRAHSLGSMGTALESVVDGLRLLCFDEFHIDDVADARFMARVLETIVAKGVTLVVTSNVPPIDLLPNPIFHDIFLPSIALIEEALDVIELGGSVDYRTAGEPSAGDRRFASGAFVSGVEAVVPWSEHVELAVGARSLTCAAIRDGAVWFDFDTLCGGSTSASDYLDLVGRFDDWVIFGVPALGATPEFSVRRFGNVVDVLYDADARLTVLAKGNLHEVAGDLGGIPGLARLASRLSILPRSTPAGNEPFGSYLVSAPVRAAASAAFT